MTPCCRRDAALIPVIAAGRAFVGFLQEYRAARAMAALRQCLVHRGRVLRDGKLAQVPADALELGDLVALSAGNLVGGDGLLREARDVMAGEATVWAYRPRGDGDGA